ncbi:ABC transporter ATP-binding protein [Streptomyces sp. NPDC050388]|uniref:ABC transporter ATP-binding protein n=1 Tax=Streptomyces sp. NPDC050388 TaxID=3155781 RepID=UPI0034409EA7
MNHVLEVRELTKAYGGVQALAGVGFHVEQAEIFAVIGPNGAGKTTLLNMISGLDVVDSGSIRILDRDVTKSKPWVNARLGLARTLQTPVVFPDMTVLENVMLGYCAIELPGFVSSMLRLPRSRGWRSRAAEAATAVLDQLDLLPYADRVPTELPLGLQRMVDVARALATSPKVILLDEPAAGLSGEEVDRLSEVLRKAAARGISVCFVEHNMRMVMSIAHRILVMNFGANLFTGAPREVAANPEVVAAYLGTKGTTGLANAHL